MPHALLLILALTLLPLTTQANQTEINRLQDKLVTLAGKLRAGESRLADLAIKQNQLDARITDAKLQMEESREEIDALLQSLIRLSRTPPEAIVVMPGELRHTIQAAQLMSRLTEQMQVKTAQLNLTLKRLKSDELELAETRESLQQQRNKLLASRKAMAKQLAERKASYEKQNKRALEKKRKQIKTAKKEAKSVKQLVKKLDKKTKSVTIQPKATKPQTAKHVAFSKRRGRLKLPVAGRITKRFGQKEGVDQTSHGYHLASASGATVTSPASGEVMFTGPFLDYDNIVILKYDSGYHLLLAGLSRIDCTVGQKVRSGEPIGRLTGSGSRANLYLELRKNGKAIDPSPWFG